MESVSAARQQERQPQVARCVKNGQKALLSRTVFFNRKLHHSSQLRHKAAPWNILDAAFNRYCFQNKKIERFCRSFRQRYHHSASIQPVVVNDSNASSAIGNNTDFEHSGGSVRRRQRDGDARGKVDIRNVGVCCTADGDVISDVSGRPVDDANDDNIAGNDARGSDVTQATIDVGVHAEEQQPPPPGDEPGRIGEASDDGASDVPLVTRQCDCCIFINNYEQLWYF